MGELTIKGAQARQNLLEWSRRVADCRSSGQTVTGWCAEHGIKPKTYYNWQRKVFSAMISEQQMDEPQVPERRFAELPAPAVQNELVATVRIRETSLDVYSGASAEIVSALCKVLSHAE